MIDWIVYCDQKRICHIQGCQSKRYPTGCRHTQDSEHERNKNAQVRYFIKSQYNDFYFECDSNDIWSRGGNRE